MRYFLACFLLLMSQVFATSTQNTFIAIAYHKVVKSIDQADADAVTEKDLVSHFQWLKERGYTPIHPDDLLKAQKGETQLPPKAVLITFDDGYESFYSIAYPLLKAFNFPAVAAIVGSWINAKEQGKQARYGSKMIFADKFMTWKQIKEISDSGLVEIASHSFDSHYGVIANPYETTQAALITQRYDPQTKRYESLEEYKKRIAKDLHENSATILKKIGKKPRIIVWPYGRYNQICVDAAKKEGMFLSLTLEDNHPNNTLESFDSVDRLYYTPDQDFSTYISILENTKKEKHPALRAVRIDLDHIYDANPEQFEKNLSTVIDRLYQYQINTVFLQAFVDTEAKGYAESVYFPNRHLPVKADIFNRVSWQIYRRGRVNIYAWLPIIAFDFKDKSLLVKSLSPEADGDGIDKKQYIRSSLFHPTARQKILEVYEDLAFGSPIQGIAFHDDVLTDFEDFSPYAVKAMQREGFPESLTAIKSNPTLFTKWTQWKSKALIDFTKEITERVKVFRPIKTTRSLFSGPVLNPESEAWFAQNAEDFLNTYDHTALMAMPYMENASHPGHWLNALLDKIKQYPLGLKKTIFELQTVDWRNNNEPIDTKDILKQIRELSAKGVKHFSLYPDDAFKNHPEPSIIKEGISLQSYPYLP